MHNDEVVWEILGKNFCSYKEKVLTDTFCRHSHNVTGLCNKVSCPLSNGYYATVVEENGVCYLCLKTIERCHLPRSMWEKVELSSNYQKALAQIDAKMKNIYKDHQIHRCKQRLTRLRQTLIRMRQMQLEPQTNLVPIKKKTERREETRESKAQTAAKLEISIEQELLDRLKKGVYGDIYNCDREAFEKTLREKEALDNEEGQCTEDELSESKATYFVEDESDSDISFEESPSLNEECMMPHKDVEELHEDCQVRTFHTKRNSSHFNQVSSSRHKKFQFGLVHTKDHSCPRVEVEYEYQDDDCEMES